MDLPLLGPVRSRAGLRQLSNLFPWLMRYSPLYRGGALVLGFRKECREIWIRGQWQELRTDTAEGYKLFIGLQSTGFVNKLLCSVSGDDERLDLLTEVGA